MVSTSGISFSGLGSGLDTNAIVSQLIAVERYQLLVYAEDFEDRNDGTVLIGL